MARAFGTFLRLQCRYTLHRWGPSWGKNTERTWTFAASPVSHQAAQRANGGRDEHQRTCLYSNGRKSHRLPAALPLFQPVLIFIERLPVAIYAGDRQDQIDQHVGVSVVEVDAEGKLLWVDAQSYALMGYCSSEEVLGRSIFDETNDEDVVADREQFRRQVAGELDRYTVEKRTRRREAPMCGHR